jgi:SAM-dependent methyltransferase
MSQEYEIACKMLSIDLPPENKEIHILNIPSGGIHLKEHIDRIIPNPTTYYCFETSPDFAKYYQECKLCSYDQIPLPDQSIDRMIVLACLHHLQKKERLNFYRECQRLLTKNGRLIIGDVIKGSPQDRWLNQFVNQWNSAGHCGLFFDEDDKKDLEEAGFTVESHRSSYEWRFRDETEMVDFVLNLFGLDLFETSHQKTELIEFIPQYLEYVKENDGKCAFKWQLIYFISNPRFS